MGLITKNIYVNLCSRNIEYYTNLGYFITKEKDDHYRLRVKRGLKLYVDVYDLPNGSHEKVWCRCDGVSCGNKLYLIGWRDYLKYKRDEKIYCSKCVHEIFAGENIRKALLKNGCSFKEWCIKYNNDKYLLLWAKQNIEKPEDYGFSSTKEIYWKCENNIHDDYKRDINASATCNFHCPECSQERKESFLQEKVRLYLISLGYIVKHENKCSIMCDNPRSGWKLLYDNEIKIGEKYLIIEVHGEQHYLLNLWHKIIAKRKNTTPQEELEYIQWKDKIKKEYVESLDKYYYLEISYTSEKSGLWKNIIDSKLSGLTLDIKRVS